MIAVFYGKGVGICIIKKDTGKLAMDGIRNQQTQITTLI